ncbi:hypothetical protein BgiBS90_030652, partial [Biomphalaria glabrata]
MECFTSAVTSAELKKVRTFKLYQKQTNETIEKLFGGGKYLGLCRACDMIAESGASLETALIYVYQ